MTDIFGKEERKQMLERIESLERAQIALNEVVSDVRGELYTLNQVLKTRTMPETKIGVPVPIPTPTDSGAITEMTGVLKEIRSGITETNSLLAAMLKKMDSVPAPLQVPPVQWVKSPNGTGGVKFTNTIPKGTTGGPPSDVSCGANPYIPGPPYGSDTLGNDRTFPGAKPLNDKEE